MRREEHVIGPMHYARKKMLTIFQLRNLKERDHLRYQDIERRIILKLDLCGKGCDCMEWTPLVQDRAQRRIIVKSREPSSSIQSSETLNVLRNITGLLITQTEMSLCRYKCIAINRRCNILFYVHFWYH
jgi:hypothetical protein